MSKVLIQSFKDSGKWNVDHGYDSEVPGYESHLLIEEAEKKFPYLKVSNYTMRCTYQVEGGQALNFRLVVNCVNEEVKKSKEILA